MQSDGNSWKIDPFSRGYNFLTYDLILILKTRPYSYSYSCEAKELD